MALFNVGYRLLRPFLALSEDEIRRSLDDNIVAAFAFAREATIAFLENTLDLKGSRGTLIFTGATASVRAKEETAAFAAGKHGVRALARSLATEFGERGIHVSGSSSGHCLYLFFSRLYMYVGCYIILDKTS